MIQKHLPRFSPLSYLLLACSCRGFTGVAGFAEAALLDASATSAVLQIDRGLDPNRDSISKPGHKIFRISAKIYKFVPRHLGRIRDSQGPQRSCCGAGTNRSCGLQVFAGKFSLSVRSGTWRPELVRRGLRYGPVKPARQLISVGRETEIGKCLGRRRNSAERAPSGEQRERHSREHRH